MNFPFRRRRGLVIVFAQIVTPQRLLSLKLALDTGATDTLISATRLERAGFDLALATSSVQITMGGNIINAPILTVPRLEALGQTRLDFPVVAHDLPSSTIVGEFWASILCAVNCSP